MTDRKLLYLAHPLSGDEDEEYSRIWSAQHVLNVAITWGVPMYSPLNHLDGVMLRDGDLGALRWFEDWTEPFYRHGLDMVERCDALVLVEHPGWESSKGVQLELAAARRLGMPVHRLGYYWVDDDRAEAIKVRTLGAKLRQWSNSHPEPLRST